MIQSNKNQRDREANSKTADPNPMISVKKPTLKTMLQMGSMLKKRFPPERPAGPGGLTGKFYQTFKE